MEKIFDFRIVLPYFAKSKAAHKSIDLNTVLYNVAGTILSDVANHSKE